MRCFRLVSLGAFALSSFVLSGSPVLARSPEVAPAPQAALPPGEVVLKSRVENVLITLKKDGKIAATLTFEKDDTSTFSARGYKMLRTNSKTDGSKTMVLSGNVVLTLQQGDKKVMELTADEITVKILTPSE